MIWDRPWSRQLFWLIPLCVLTAGSAAGAGWALRVQNPFKTPPKVQTGVPRQETPQAQYYHAMLTPGDPAGWQAVLEYFSSDEKAVMECERAELRLAMIDLQNDRLPDAETRLNKMLIEGQGGNPWKKAHALAGLAVIDSLKGHRDDSRQKLSDVKKMERKLDAVMNDALEETIRRNSRG